MPTLAINISTVNAPIAPSTAHRDPESWNDIIVVGPEAIQRTSPAGMMRWWVDDYCGSASAVCLARR